MAKQLGTERWQKFEDCWGWQFVGVEERGADSGLTWWPRMHLLGRHLLEGRCQEEEGQGQEGGNDSVSGVRWQKLCLARGFT